MPIRSLPKGIEVHYPPKGKTSVLLVVPSFHRESRLTGPAYLAASLSNLPTLQSVARNSKLGLPEPVEPIHVRVLDLSRMPKDFNLPAFLERFDPSIIGVTAYTTTLAEATAISLLAKDTIPNAFRLVGGYHPSAVPGDTLLGSKFQIAGVGYGEETISELAMFLHHFGRKELERALGEIPGLSFKDGQGKIRHNSRRRYAIPLDDLPSPHTAHSTYLFDGYSEEADGVRAGHVVASRGCPFSCKYCSGETMHERRMRFRSAANVLAEVRALHAMGRKLISFDDEILGLFREMDGLLGGLAALKQEDPEFGWAMETRGDRLTPELIERLAAAGLKQMAFGVETGDEVLARDIKRDRRLSNATIGANTSLAQARGISVAYNLIVGLPGQDWISVLQSALMLREHQPDRAGATDYFLFPGSEFAESLTASGQFKIVDRGGAVELPHMTRAEVLSAVRDLEFLVYYMRMAKAHPEAAEEFQRIYIETITDKFRIWAIYERLLYQAVRREPRVRTLEKLARTADPIFQALLTEREKKRYTLKGVALSVEPAGKELLSLELYEKYSRALNLQSKLKSSVLDPFLRDVVFQNAAGLARLPFAEIRIFILLCATIYCNLLAESGQSGLRTIAFGDQEATAKIIGEKIRGKTTKDINTAQEHFDLEKLESGEAVELMGIPLRYDSATGTLLVIGPAD